MRRSRGGSQAVPATDPNCTAATKRLYRRLLAEYGGGRIAAGAGERVVRENTNTPATYDTDQLMIAASGGKVPVWQAWEWVDPLVSAAGYAETIEQIKAHHRAGGMCGIHFHEIGPQTGRGTRSRSQSDYSDVTQALAGGTANATWRAYLDRFATFCNALVADDGTLIPIVRRWLHEANGWFDYTPIAITSAAWSNGVYTFGTATAHNLAPSNDVFTQGAANANYNKSFLVSTTPTTTTFTVAGWPSDPGAPGSLASATVYECSGFWWAGADRAADYITLLRETITYLRDTKGVHNVLHAWCIYPFDGNLYANSNPATHAYSTWWPGEDYVDVVTVDYYGESAGGWGMDKAALRSSMAGITTYCDTYGKPLMFAELGYQSGGGAQVGLWKDKTTDVILRDYPQARAFMCWSSSFVPAPADAGYPSFQAALADSRVRGL